MSAGQHSLVFLTTLEAGLAPTHRLDPPLWGGPGKGAFTSGDRGRANIYLRCSFNKTAWYFLEEKALPRLRKRTTAAGTGAMLDYVFRIVRIGGGNEFNLSYRQELDDDARLSPETQR